MGASASLDATEVEVFPGEETTVELHVTNTGTTLDEFSFAPVGMAQGWISVEPPSVSLYPGAASTVRLQLRPPRSFATTAGQSPFAVKVVSHEDPESSVAVEATVNVAPFVERTIELVPETARGRRAARFALHARNTGNATALLRLGAVDLHNQLGFNFKPPTLNVEPGVAHYSDLTVRPRRRFWRGPSKTWPLRVVVEEPEHDPITVDGAMLQEALAPPWLGWAVLGVLLLLGLWALFWFALVKPTIHDEVKQQTKSQIAPIQSALTAAGITAPPTTVKGGTLPPTTAPTTTTPSPYGKPVSFRLSSQVPQYAVPVGQVLSVTDIVLQNPDGNTGRFQITRSGQVLFDETLNNFFTLSLNFVSPYQFPGGTAITAAISCTGPPGGKCTAAATVSGFQRSA
jgi:hypothetical protein